MIRLTATGEIKIIGNVTADGLRSATNGGGGAGGSVVIQAGTVSGTGLITVNGGNGTTSYSSGAGGGGRIAVTATVHNFAGEYQAYGGMNFPSTSTKYYNNYGGPGELPHPHSM